MLLSIILVAFSSAGLINAAALTPSTTNKGSAGSQALDSRQNNNKQNSNASQTVLAANALQTASQRTGQEAGTDGIKAGQAPSAT